MRKMLEMSLRKQREEEEKEEDVHLAEGMDQYEEEVQQRPEQPGGHEEMEGLIPEREKIVWRMMQQKDRELAQLPMIMTPEVSHQVLALIRHQLAPCKGQIHVRRLRIQCSNNPSVPQQEGAMIFYLL